MEVIKTDGNKGVNEGWIGVDLDGTLAEHTHWKGNDHIGKPIEPMVRKVKDLIKQGFNVRIFTARVSESTSPRELSKIRTKIMLWCKENLGTYLQITDKKDFEMICLYDDRAIAVESNTGKILGGKEPEARK